MISRLAKKGPAGGAGLTNQTAALRVDRDLSNLEGTSANVTLPDPNDKLTVEIVVKPLDGLWRGGTFKFRLIFPSDYPHNPPVCRYLGPTRLWHPNIEGDADRAEGGVCLNILRDEWRPVRGIRDIVFGLEMMFFEPNIEDPLPGTAKLAAQQFKDDFRGFQQKAQRWLGGNYS
jgi:ubiquitin-conjugating enzyme E2 M